MQAPCALVSDLDGTLIHALRTLPEEHRARAVVVEHYQGRPITVVHRHTIETIRSLCVHARFVPATTRSAAQLQRVTPIWEHVAANWAICANGATIMHQGSPDEEWRRKVERRAQNAATVEQVRSALKREFGEPEVVPWLGSWRSCETHFLYAVFDPDDAPPGTDAQAGRLLESLGWVAVRHGRKLYVLPRHLTKGAATEHLRDRLEIERLLAAGDSLLDLDLLEAADRAWVPSGSELATAGLAPPVAELTARPHVHSGHQIAREALDDVTAFAVS